MNSYRCVQITNMAYLLVTEIVTLHFKRNVSSLLCGFDVIHVFLINDVSLHDLIYGLQSVL